MRSVVLALALVAGLGTPADSGPLAGRSQGPNGGKAATEHAQSGPVDENNRPRDGAPPRYRGRVDARNLPLDVWPDAPPALRPLIAEPPRAESTEAALATEVIVFPATGDTRFTQAGPDFWVLGDYVEGVRNLLNPANEVEMVLNISSNGLTCDTQDHALKIDGVTVGLFSISPGDTVVTRNFAFPAIAPGAHTIRIENVRTVAPGCGCAGFPDDVSTLTFENSTGSLVFPDVGDTRFTQAGTSFWNAGDFVEGVRNFPELTDEIEMVLTISPNGLTCDTQDHAFIIDGNTVGSFVVSPGEGQITRRFLFPALPAGPHTIRIETTRTVNGGCGAAGFPNGISLLNLFYTPGDKVTFPATGDPFLFQGTFGPWVLGDFIEGVRDLTEPTDAVDMMLQVGPNGLTCDTQDLALLIDGNVIGNFSINPGQAQVNQSFTFPAISAGQHTIRLENVRRVNPGCGAAALPLDVSMLRFLLPSLEPGSVPPTISVERLGTGQLRIRWAAGLCPGAEDYGIYEGTIGNWYDHTALPGHCSDTDPFFEADVAASPGDRYYLVVPQRGSGEGFYGAGTFGVRPVGLITCEPNQVLGCSSIASNDYYDVIGNVSISVPAGAGLLANDGPGAVVTAASPSAAGGGVSANPDGSFTYEPAPGFSGIDTFTYDVDDGMTTGSATAFLNVSTPIWFIDNTAGGANLGTLADPFLSLFSFDAVNGDGGPSDPESGDCVFLYTGTGLHTDGVDLESGQKLIGQGAGDSLATLCGVVVPPHSPPLPPTGGVRPVIQHLLGAGIGLAGDHLIRGLNLGDTLLAGLDGLAGNLTVREMLILGQGATMSVANGTLDVVLDSLHSTNTSGLPALSLSNVGGSMTVTGATSFSGNIGGPGILIGGSGAGFDFGSTAIEKAGTPGDGVQLVNNFGTISFRDLSILTGSGTGLLISASGQVSVGPSPSAISASGGPAADISNTSIDMTFTDLLSSAGGSGLWLSDTPGTFQVTGGMDVASTFGDAISILNNSALDVDFFNIDVNSAAGFGLAVTGPVGDFDVALSTAIDGTGLAALSVIGAGGSTLDFGDTTLGQGVPVALGANLLANPGATLTFAGLDVITAGGHALKADDSGTVVVTGAPALQAVGGPAADVMNTLGDIDGSGTWRLSAPSSQASPSWGLRFGDLAQDVELFDVDVEDAGSAGVFLADIAGTVSLSRGSVTFPGGGSDADGVRADDVEHLVIQGDPGNPFVVDGAGGGGGASAGHGVHASAGPAVTLDQVSITNISDAGGAVLESGIYLEDISGSISITSSTVQHVVSGDAIFVENCNTVVDPCDPADARSLPGTLTLNITGNDLTGVGNDLTLTTADGVRLEYRTSNGGRVVADISGNTIDNVNQGINVKLRGNGGTGADGAHRVRVGGGETNLGAGQVDPDANPNVITDFRNDGMDLSFEDSTVSKWFVRNNSVDAFVNHPGAQGIDVARDIGISYEVVGVATGTSGTADLFLINNTVRDNTDEGIRVRGFGDPITATVNMLLQDNDVQDNGDEFRVEVGDAGTFNATVANNVAIMNDAGGADFLFGHRNIITGAPTLRVRLFDNNADGYDFERTSSAVHEIGCTLSGSPACPLGATTVSAPIVTVLDKMGNATGGTGIPLVFVVGASGSLVVVDESVIPVPVP